jgi:hypothetical protein
MFNRNYTNVRPIPKADSSFDLVERQRLEVGAACLLMFRMSREADICYNVGRSIIEIMSPIWHTTDVVKISDRCYLSAVQKKISRMVGDAESLGVSGSLFADDICK